MRKVELSLRIKNFIDQHAFLASILASLIASGILGVFTSFFNIPYVIYIAFYNPKDTTNFDSLNTEGVEIKLWIVLAVVLFILSWFVFMCIYFKRKHDVYQKYITEIKETNETLSAAKETIENQLKSKNSEIDKYEEWDVLCKTLSDYTRQSEVVESIQLFSYSDLPNVCDINPKADIEISFHFEGGCAKEKSNVNVLYNMNYQFKPDIYEALINLFEKRNEYYSEKAYSRKANKTIEKDIQADAIKIFNKIALLLNDISDISQIDDVHYAYYRMLEVLSNVVLSPTKAVECKGLLNVKLEIEQQLKTGQRTGMLGTLFTKSTYSFCNENSSIKRNRSYFTSPLIYKGRKLVLLVILERDKLRLGPNGHDDIKCCEKIYDEIAIALKSNAA